MRYNPKLRKFIDDEVDNLLRKELIYQVESPYSSKVILAPKGPAWRMCIDFRRVN